MKRPGSRQKSCARRAGLAATVAVVSEMDSMRDWLGEMFAQVGNRFDRMDERFDRMDERFDGVDARLDRLKQRVDEIAAVNGTLIDEVAAINRRLA